jgi:hypothetical protein
VHVTVGRMNCRRHRGVVAAAARWIARKEPGGVQAGGAGGAASPESRATPAVASAPCALPFLPFHHHRRRLAPMTAPSTSPPVAGGLDVSPLRALALRALLSALDAIPEGKTLLLDASLAGPLGLVADVGALRQHGVERMFWLEEPKEKGSSTKEQMVSAPTRAVVYVCRPDAKWLRVVAGEYRLEMRCGGLVVASRPCCPSAAALECLLSLFVASLPLPSRTKLARRLSFSTMRRRVSQVPYIHSPLDDRGLSGSAPSPGLRSWARCPSRSALFLVLPQRFEDDDAAAWIRGHSSARFPLALQADERLTDLASLRPRGG